MSCYCGGKQSSADFLKCNMCQVQYHAECVTNGPPGSLIGDNYFNYLCKLCGPAEKCERIPLRWVQAIWLALHNLQLKSIGKRGYFHWKEDICTFIDKHWIDFFGTSKNKKCVWHGTVAGILSNNSPQYFKSGQKVLGETGYWIATENKPPSASNEKQGASTSKQTGKRSSSPSLEILEKFKSRPRRSTAGSLKAAMERKASQSEIQLPKRRRVSKTAKTKKDISSEKLSETTTASNIVIKVEHDIPSVNIKNEPEINEAQALTELNFKTEMKIKEEPIDASTLGDIGDLLPVKMESDSDLDVDPCAMSPDCYDDMKQDADHLPAIADIFGAIETSEPKESVGIQSLKLKIESNNCIDDVDNPSLEQTPMTSCNQSEDSDSSPEDVTESVEQSEEEQSSAAQSVTEKPSNDTEPTQKERILPLSLYEEKMLLNKVSSLKCDSKMNLENIAFRQLRRKLLVRQQKRQYCQPVFDIDKRVCELCGYDPKEEEVITRKSAMPETFYQNGGNVPGQCKRLLDRFQNVNMKHSFRTYTSFTARLVGTEEDQLQCIKSPYTSRILKPFIRRDYMCTPAKLKLLREIEGYRHRNDVHWKPSAQASIDYCYVRPQHIPSVNALCREFFWPGIDLSECLQYPDFSCIVMYKHLVIGFGFMVPDVKYNEAYISFLFTHPEWRRAGIAKFMLYHLIQTCMGKDVTLHVSVSNPALLLYQKFGFKPEEYILNFYEKYFPAESKECRHAFFLRLKR